MKVSDALYFSQQTLRSYRSRTLLMLLAMAIGVAAVIILTSLGDGARRYITGEFASLGTNLLIVLPGRSETTGAAPGLFMGETPRDLTINDAMALERTSLIRRVAPLMIGSTHASWQQREREVPILGSTSELLQLHHWKMKQGRFFPAEAATQTSPVAVIGANVRRELFGRQPALGQWMRLGERRYRVIGILATEGRSIGLDVEDLVIIPVASAQVLFNSPSLFRILVEAKTRSVIPDARGFILKTIRKRHQGEADITVITQDAVLSTFDRIFQALTLTVAGIAAISLAVAGILIMNVMLVSVTQRMTEIGLLKAIGASRRHIYILFLTEAVILSFIGACAGLLLGQAGSWLISLIYPALPAGAPLWAVLTAFGVALVTGLLFGLLPARRAARLDPIAALSRQ